MISGPFPTAQIHLHSRGPSLQGPGASPIAGALPQSPGLTQYFSNLPQWPQGRQHLPSDLSFPFLEDEKSQEVAESWPGPPLLPLHPDNAPSTQGPQELSLRRAQQCPKDQPPKAAPSLQPSLRHPLSPQGHPWEEAEAGQPQTPEVGSLFMFFLYLLC